MPLLFAKAKLIFYGIPRTGTTSLVAFLKERIGGPIIGHKHCLYWSKSDLVAMAKLGIDPTECEGFCVVRNPFDRILSCWGWGTRISGFYRKIHSFEDFVLDYMPKHFPHWREDGHRDQHLRSMLAWTHHAQTLPGACKKLHVLRYENLVDDLNEFGDSMGLDLDFSEMPHLYISGRQTTTYHEHYTPEMQSVLEVNYHQDMEQYVYEWECDTCIVIPARYASTRLPGKLLLPLGDTTVLGMTCRAARRCRLADSVWVFCDDKKLAAEARKHTENVVMTSRDCRNGTERICRYIDELPEKYKYVVNVQGDEPLVDYRNIEAAIRMHKGLGKWGTFCTTLHQQIDDYEYAASPASVKVVFGKNNRALYYSRALIPALKDTTKPLPPSYAFTGIYVFHRDHLIQYNLEEDTPLQLTEDIEQLKILELGYVIKTYECPVRNERSINTPEDYQYIKGLFGR